jgi:general secretion pathway protein F
MHNFSYRAVDAHGKQLKGKVQAISEIQARQQLKAAGYIVLEVKVKRKHFLQLNVRIKTQDICLFTRQLATLLNAGIPLTEALSGLANEQSQENLKHMIQGVQQKVLEGFSLAQALKQYPESFSNLYCATIYAGEQSGQLDQVLNQLADYIEQQHYAKQKIQQALIYPSLMISVACLIIIFLMTQVVPKILSIFDDNQQELPFVTKILIHSSHLLSQLFPFILIGGVILAYYLHHQKSNTDWLYQRYQSLTQIKIYRQFVKLTQIPQYLHTIRILLTSGVNVLESMQVASQMISNLAIRDIFNQATKNVKEGMSISQALQKTNWFTSMTLHLIQSGEKSGQITTMMERAAQQIDMERQQCIDTGLKLLEPIIILAMGSFVLFIVLAILLPIFQMQQLV